MIDLLKEKWVQDGCAVYSETIKNVEGYSVQICDMDEGYWDTDEIDGNDMGAFASLIAHAPDMYRMLHSIATAKTASIKEIRALLAAIKQGD